MIHISNRPTASYVLFIARLLLAAALALTLLPLRALPARAESGVLLVDTFADDPSLTACTAAPGDCSLRGAVTHANQSDTPDTIQLSSGVYTLTGDEGENDNKSGDLDVKEAGGGLTLLGAGRGDTFIRSQFDADSYTWSDRLIDTSLLGSKVTLTIKDLTLENGNPGFLKDGGAVRAYSSLTLESVTIRHCGGDYGGGIYFFTTAQAVLTLKNVLMENNSATSRGGAIYAEGGRINIDSSTFADNAAGLEGGAIYTAGQLSLVRSTLASNRAARGGGLFNRAFLGDLNQARINSSTFWNNRMAIYNRSSDVDKQISTAQVLLSNTILADNGTGKNCENEDYDNPETRIIDEGGNLDSGVTCNLKKSLFGKDPLLESLADNGGPLPTVALKSGSPAIDAGDPSTCPMRDQRGLAVVTVCDIGAFESGGRVYLSAQGGAAGSAHIGDVPASPLKVWATNALGNPLREWTVYFSPEHPSVRLSSAAEVTGPQGTVQVAAAPPEGGSGVYFIDVRAGSSTLKFSLTAAQSMPVAGSATPGLLPNTGFAPGVVTARPAQPLEKGYAQDELVLSIPRLGVELPVVGVPKTTDGWDLTWLSAQAGYLEGTAFPTWAGNSVLTGHAVLADGSAGPFARLGELAWGDRVEINAWGQSYIYEVRSVEVVRPDDTRVLGHEEQPWLTLLTCQDYNPQRGSYNARLAVRAVLVEVK